MIFNSSFNYLYLSGGGGACGHQVAADQESSGEAEADKARSVAQLGSECLLEAGRLEERMEWRSSSSDPGTRLEVQPVTTAVSTRTMLLLLMPSKICKNCKKFIILLFKNLYSGLKIPASRGLRTPGQREKTPAHSATVTSHSETTSTLTHFKVKEQFNNQKCPQPQQ